MSSPDTASSTVLKPLIPMEYRYLGRSGLRVSAISFGAWVTWGASISDDEAFACMKAAYELGCNFFDNAEVYAGGKAETTMGKCLKRLNVERSAYVVSTKLFWGGAGVNEKGLSRKHIIEGTRASLKRLDLEYVDLLFAHRPDPATPMEEIVRAFNFVIEKGYALYWGTSEWSAEQITEAVLISQKLGLISPIMEQPQYSMLHRTRFEVEYSSIFNSYGLGTTIWSPLACGLLTGKYTSVNTFPADSRLGGNSNYKWLKDQLLNGEGMNGLEMKSLEQILLIVEKLTPIAAKLECTLAQLAIAWTLANQHVTTVITGASKVSQIVENFAALTILKKLTPHILEEIEVVLGNKPKPVKSYK